MFCNARGMMFGVVSIRIRGMSINKFDNFSRLFLSIIKLHPGGTKLHGSKTNLRHGEGRLYSREVDFRHRGGKIPSDTTNLLDRDTNPPHGKCKLHYSGRELSSSSINLRHSGGKLCCSDSKPRFDVTLNCAASPKSERWVCDRNPREFKACAV